MKKPTWQSLQNRIGGRFLAPSQQLFANGVMVGDNNKNMNPTGNLTRAQACVLISKSLFKLSEFGRIMEPIYSSADVVAVNLSEQLSLTRQDTLSNYGGNVYQLLIGQDGFYKITVSGNGIQYFVYAGGQETIPNDSGYYFLKKDSSPLIYVSGSSEGACTLDIKGNVFTIDNMNYNNGSGAKLGIDNSVMLELSKSSNQGNGTYYVSLYCSGDDSEGAKRSETQEVILTNSTPVSVTFDGVALYGGGAGNLNTYVKVSMEENGSSANSNRKTSVIDGILPQKLQPFGDVHFLAHIT